MKIMLVIMTVFFVQVSASGLAQQITLKREKISLREFFTEIKKQTTYHVVWRSSELNNGKTLKVDFHNTDLREALTQVLGGQGLGYDIKDETVVIYVDESKTIRKGFNNTVNAGLQQYVVKGRVISEADGEALPGATVRLKSEGISVMTGSDGRFSLKSNKADGALEISFIGYKSQVKSFKSSNNSDLIIQLLQDENTLEETVVVGYGAQKKVNLTGAVSTVSGKVLENRPINNVAQGLQGTVPNLTITPSSGNPSSDPGINVRGTTSINGGGPLVLVDGVEMNMNLVNPNDISSVTVLKDAASAAIYGVRAAFGVILITTKSASTTDRTTVSYNNNFGFSQPSAFPEIVDKNYEHAEYINQAMANAGLAPLYSDVDIAGMKAWTEDPINNPSYAIVGGSYRFYGYNDWKKLLLKDYSFSQRHNLSISGGSGKTTFFSSVGYNDQSGFIKINPDQFKRLNTRINVENQTTNWLKLGLKALYNHTTTNEPFNYGNSTWHQFVFTSPVKPYMWTGDSNYPEYDKYIGMYFDDQNPMSLLDKGGRNNYLNEDLWTTVNADLKFMKGWTGHIDFNYNLNTDDDSYHRKKVDMIKANFVPTEGNTNNNSYELDNNRRDYYSINAYTQYEATYGKNYLKGMVGYNQELTKYRSNSGTRLGLLNQDMPSLSLGSGEQRVSQTGYEWALRGGFFRLNYIYNDRYLIEVNGRYDGTSRFPSDDRFVFLPSVSAGWRISEESFMEWSRGTIDNLKIRGSYGQLGNQLLTSSSWTGNTRYYPYVAFMTSGISSNYVFGNQTSVVVNPPTLVPSSLTWEKASTIDAGLDLTMFKSKLDVVFDWYQRTTSDMLTSVAYPELLGASSPVENSADLRTRGWEVSVNWKDRVNDDLDYSIGIVVGDSQAEITKFNNPTGSLTNYYVGQKLGEIWGYTTEGFFQSAEEVSAHANQSRLGSNWAAGDIKYKDIDGNQEISNGDNTISNPGDRSVIGNTTPRYTYGFTANVNYKGFFLNLFAQGVGKRDFWPSAQDFWPVATQYYATQKWWVTDSWTPDNPNAYFARPVARDSKNQQSQTKYLQDASYVRLKNLTLGYSFRADWLKRAKLSGAQLFLSGENLFYISPIKGSYDPESAGSNGGMIYPYSRTYSIGLSVTY